MVHTDRRYSYRFQYKSNSPNSYPYSLSICPFYRTNFSIGLRRKYAEQMQKDLAGAGITSRIDAIGYIEILVEGNF